MRNNTNKQPGKWITRSSLLRLKVVLLLFPTLIPAYWLGTSFCERKSIDVSSFNPVQYLIASRYTAQLAAEYFPPLHLTLPA